MKKIITAIAATLFFVCSMAQAPVPVQRTINVNGVAEMSVVPDEIYIQVDLREYDKKNAGKVDIATIRSNFLSACQSIGIADTDIVVQSYQGWDGNYWWYKKNKKQNPDMKAGISYWVKLKSTAMIDKLVNKLDDEATQNFFIAKVDHSKMDEFKKQLKIEAIKAAKEKANYLSAAIGENVGEAITINEPNEINFPRPVYANVMMKSVAGVEQDESAPMNVDYKKMDLKFEVNVVFALK